MLKRVLYCMVLLLVLAKGGFCQRIRIGLLPILESLPVYVAHERALFPKGIEVVPIPTPSAAERDQLLSIGELDAVINDLLAVALFNREKPQLVAVNVARVPTPTHPQFFLLSSPKGRVIDLKGLEGASLAISEFTVIHYVTERLLEVHGVDPQKVKFVSIPRISERMSALMAGHVEAATLPDPLALLALKEGAKLLLDDSRCPHYSLSVYSFRSDFVNKHPEAVKAFLQGISRAVGLLREEKGKWTDLLFERKLVPGTLAGSYTLPEFPRPFVPKKSQWEDVVKWALDKKLLKAPLPYEGSIADKFLSP